MATYLEGYPAVYPWNGALFISCISLRQMPTQATTPKRSTPIMNIRQHMYPQQMNLHPNSKLIKSTAYLVLITIRHRQPKLVSACEDDTG